MKKYVKIFALVSISTLATACFNKKRSNYQLFPNMYESVAYETNSESKIFKNGMEAQTPAQGSIPRGFEVYEYPDTPEGREAAKLNSKSPLDSLQQGDLDKGKALFDIYCAVCHGEKGDGKGVLVKKEKFMGVPSYADRELTEGGIYHVITYGLNSMGPHKNQLTPHERWLVTAYVQQLKSQL